jgi:peptidyl-prolyl cis-trans isomerase A (cyclophilin A)
MKKLTALLFSALLSLNVFAANPQVEMKTTEGVIVVELFEDKAPISVANFLQYAKDKFYNGTVFHRVIDGFMIQGGGFTSDMKQKDTRAPIRNEAQNGLKNLPGTLAMARTRDPNSASSQFFINLVDNASLDYPSPDGAGYAVFGKVVGGMEIVQKIAKTATGNKGSHQNVPFKPIVIESVTLITAKK